MPYDFDLHSHWVSYHPVILPVRKSFSFQKVDAILGKAFANPVVWLIYYLRDCSMASSVLNEQIWLSGIHPLRSHWACWFLFLTLWWCFSSQQAAHVRASRWVAIECCCMVKNRRISVTYVLTKYTMALNLGKYEWSSQQKMDSITAVSQVASFLLTPITAFN